MDKDYENITLKDYLNMTKEEQQLYLEWLRLKA